MQQRVHNKHQHMLVRHLRPDSYQALFKPLILVHNLTVWLIAGTELALGKFVMMSGVMR
jgi:hypothetical protein